MEESISRISLQVAIVAAVIFVILPSVGSASTYVVNSTADVVDSNIGDNICATSGAVCTLRAAVQEANGHSGSDTITIPAGTYLLSLTGANEEVAATGDLDLTDTSGTLTITGAGSGSTIIDGNSAVNSTDDRVFDIASSANASMSGLTVTGGTINGSGGRGAGIRINGGSTVTLSNMIISGNTFTNTNSPSFSNGAGLYCTGNSALTVSNSSINDNGTLGQEIDGAGTYVDINCDADFDTVTVDGNIGNQRGGGLHIRPSTALTKTFTNLTVSNNTGNVGGGIFMLGSSSSDIPIVLTKSTITGNTALSYAGGIQFAARAYATNLTVTSNTTVGDGGGIYIYNETYVDVVVAFSTIVNNTSNSDSSGGGNGGGIYVQNSNADFILNGSVVAGNVANSASGPNCYATAGFTSASYNLFENLTNCSISSTSNNTTTSSVSNIVDASLANNGGSVQTLAIYSSDLTDIIPAGSCLDAAGATLTTDARSMSRAQPAGGSCDRGAYEKDQTNPTVTITTGTDTVQCVTGSWTNAGATVTDNFSTGLTASVTSGSVNVNALGTYPIVYTSIADVDGNTGTNTRTVTVSDTAGPTITLTGSNNITHEAATTYTDAGATATDSCDSTITVITAGSIATTTLGAQTLTYSAVDDSNNAATQKTRTVTVVDTTIPVITLVGETTVTVAHGATYTDAGATATDSFQGSLTANIVTTNPVNTLVADTYTVTYNVSDASNNAATAVTRTVIVQAAPADDTIEDPEDTTEETEESGEPIVTTNGKYVIVTVDGIVVDRMKVNHGTFKPKYYALATKSLYQNYTSVILLTADKTHAKLTVARLMANNQLTKKTIVTFAITERAPLSLDVNRQRDRITVTVGQGHDQIEKTYHLTKTGKLKLLP